MRRAGGRELLQPHAGPVALSLAAGGRTPARRTASSVSSRHETGPSHSATVSYTPGGARCVRGIRAGSICSTACQPQNSTDSHAAASRGQSNQPACGTAGGSAGRRGSGASAAGA